MKLTPTEFFKKYAGLAVNDSIFSDIPASITLAQAAIESGWGGSSLTVKANNFFGIKQHDWKGAVYNANTNEYYNGSNTPTVVNDNFRWYGSPYESFMDHSNFLHQHGRYDSLFKLNPLDYKSWAYGLENANYATSPSYAEDLISVIEKYNLQQYDIKAANLRTLKNITFVLFILALLFAAFVIFKSVFK